MPKRHIIKLTCVASSVIVAFMMANVAWTLRHSDARITAFGYPWPCATYDRTPKLRRTPLWTIEGWSLAANVGLALLVSVSSAVAVGSVLGWFRRPAGICPACGYDVHATLNAGRVSCPECGQPLPSASRTAPDVTKCS